MSRVHLDHESALGCLECTWMSTARPLFGIKQFGRVEPPRSHEKLHYDHCSLWSSVVDQWFEQVRKT